MKTLLPFLILVLVHHFFLTPLIRKKFPLYLGLLTALLVSFGVWCFSSGERLGDPPPPLGRGEGPALRQAQGPGPSTSLRDRDVPLRDRRGPDRNGRPLRPEVMKLIMGVLLIGADLGIFFYVESRRKERRMKELQAENLSQRLESLRYQINPHFFMNTLNNIHALVDIDPEKAKESIEEFSKMMRILLYEGDAPTIPLTKELDFIEHFISLMRLRYPEDTVHIETIFPEDRSGVSVPPLVMASFVENSFKHGVSYSSESFVRVKVERQEDKVVFLCSNSVHPSEGDERHGVGLENIKKRMALLYGNTYTLSIDETDGRYEVMMAIPPQPEIQLS
jgi:hypothetical protein